MATGRVIAVAKESENWQQIVSSYKGAGEVKWEAVGGINPADGPVALCVGGNNRLTGELAPDFWGASCDADEEEVGKFLRKSVVPTAILAKAHMPDLAKVVPAFNVESIESNAGEFVKQRVSRRKVEFESLEFNQRFLATVPEEHDPIALRELFSPGFLEWTTTIDREVDFGINDRQLWFLWRLKERTAGGAEARALERRRAFQATPRRDGRRRDPSLSARTVERGT